MLFKKSVPFIGVYVRVLVIFIVLTARTQCNLIPVKATVSSVVNMTSFWNGTFCSPTSLSYSSSCSYNSSVR